MATKKEEVLIEIICKLSGSLETLVGIVQRNSPEGIIPNDINLLKEIKKNNQKIGGLWDTFMQEDNLKVEAYDMACSVN